MKVIAFNGSARKQGNTAILINHVFSELKKEGIETELFELAGKKIQGCTACYKCFETKDGKCAVKNDIVNDCIEKMLEADGIILGSPTYFADVTSEMKALIERSGFTAMANGVMFKRKVGAAVVAVRRGGAIHAFDSINHFFLINQMIVPGSSYWNMGMGREIGDVDKDDDGFCKLESIHVKYPDAIWITGGAIGLDSHAAKFAMLHWINLWLILPFPLASMSAE